VVGVALSQPPAEAAVPSGSWHRTILVVGEDPELAVALRDRLDRALVTVCEVRTSEAAAAAHACRPWPWMLVGGTQAVDAALSRRLAGHPVLLLWRGPVPSGLPRHVRAITRFAELAGTVDASLHATVSGISLSVGSGLSMPDGSQVASPVLEALVSSHPRPLPVSPRQLRAASATLSAHGVPLAAARRACGAVLVPVEAG
jgi:hypothetical protein